MHFDPFNVTIPHVFYACLGGFVVLFGMFSLFLREKLYIGEACWAFLFGVIIGPYGADIFNPREWAGSSPGTVDTITLEFTRVVLAIGVFAIGVELPKAYMARHWRSLAFLLIPVMTWGWFVSAGLIFALVPGLNFLSSLAVAACLTPTDPILASAVIGGKYADKHVPAHIRHLLAAESGCNDGAAFPFLYLALYLIIDDTTGHAIRDWFLVLWLYEVVLGVVIGSLIGFAFRHLMKFCERNNLIDRQSYVAQYISLAVLTIGITTLLGSDDLLSAFACGTVFAWDGFFNRQTEESVFSSVIDLLFNVAAFVYVGAWMPFNTFNDAALTLSPWRLVVLALLVLLLRRLPIMMALYKWIPDVKTFREAVFSGHFGPIGIGGVFISTLAAQKLPTPSNPPADQTEMLAATIQPIVAFMVLCSITLHGLSIPSFSLGRRVHSVSQTWSRHAPSDWINQARRVDRPEDIIINRDSEMERGELTPDEKLASDRSITRSPTKERGSDEESLAETEIVAEADDRKTEEKSLRDDDKIVSEWKEGPHKVVERRAGPGEEVEVEVVKNAFASSEAEQMSQHFHGTEDHVQRSLHTHLQKLKTAPHELEKDVEHAEHAIHDGAKDIENKARRAFSRNSSPEDDEDEGWASDQSVNQEGSSSSATDHRKRAKSSKIPSTPIGAPPRKGRRRNSMRKGMFGRVHMMKQKQPDDAPAFEDDDGEGEEDNERGRSPADSNASGSSRGSSLRRGRFDTLWRIDTRSRDGSPARSVRFADADENRSGANTPRISILQETSSPSSPLQNSLDDSRSKVTFDLPESGKP